MSTLNPGDVVGCRYRWPYDLFCLVSSITTDTPITLTAAKPQSGAPMNKIDTTLSVIVTPATPHGRARYATRIAVKVGEKEVALKTLGGRYSQSDALREWNTNPNTFLKTEHADLLRLVF